MRIIKLSETEFSTLHDVRTFFDSRLPYTTPPGKFRITKGRIAKDGLQPGEQLLFSYNGTIEYVALSDGKRLENSDEFSDEYPFYFQVDMTTLRPVQMSLSEIEERFHCETNETKSLVQSQGWPKIENQSFADDLWASLIQE